jgi:hypothetical protein
VLAVLLALAVAADVTAAPQDDDDAAAPGTALPALDAAQQRAAGIVTAHPLKANVPQRDEAIGLVLDAADLVGAAAEADAAAAAARAAATELTRARGLYGAGAGASLKAVQAAEAEQARTRAAADAAAARFTARWGAIAAMAAPTRQKLLASAGAGQLLLVRADLSGRHLIGSMPDRALLDVDGTGVAGDVLGVLAHGAEEAQGAGILVAVHDPPPGLGTGARIPVALFGAAHAGLLVPREAIIYADGGALAYKQLAAGNGPTRYAPVRLELLQAYGDSWLVAGVDDDDDIVVHGAGVLWSLQGILGHAAGDADDDD